MKKQKFKAILLIDFDNTIVNSAYPEIHGLKKDAKLYINKLYDEGFCIIINTCRTGSEQERASNYLKNEGVKFHLINENHPALIDYFNEDSRKLSGDIHYDDRNIELQEGMEGNWKFYYALTHVRINRKNFSSVLSLVGLNI